MKKYVLFGHGGSGNHGCEAIVRSTCKILGEENKFFLYSKNPVEDKFFGLTETVKTMFDKDYFSPSAKSLKGLYYRALAKLNKDADYDLIENVKNNKCLLKKNAVALSVGGDNYCYGGIVNDLKAKINALEYKKIPIVLWGCSIGQNELYESALKDIKRYDLITSRESLTIENLYNVGVKDNVIACVDPAFTLEKEKTDYKKDIFDSGNVIGLNVSSLMSNYEPYKDATVKNFISLINYLLKNTDSFIALIPHVNFGVGKDVTGDVSLCKSIEKTIGSERVFTVGADFNCMQLKYMISKCKTFVGCRTHSTIAAYSTCVPTLVVGYSVKSKGIAKDIFGEYNGLVVNGKTFATDDDLKNAYIAFSERQNDVKKRLKEFMPEYVKRAYNGKSAVENLFK